MPEKKIKILSWNVEHFKSNKVDNVVELIKEYEPDIFGLYEVETGIVYELMLRHFPNHSIFITTGQQSQEILVACSNKFQGIKFEQKERFKSGNPKLRPGAFLTFRFPGPEKMFAFLFLHTDSGTTAVDFGNRTEMFRHTFNLKRKLDKIIEETSNFVALGDLNTMGLKYPRPWKRDKILFTKTELEYIDFESTRKGKGAYKGIIPNLRRLSKPEGTYFSNEYGISDLDHIIASNHLSFKKQANYGEPGEHEIRLDGWRRFLGDEKKQEEFAETISDHCLLFCELIVE